MFTYTGCQASFVPIEASSKNLLAERKRAVSVAPRIICVLIHRTDTCFMTDIRVLTKKKGREGRGQGSMSLLPQECALRNVHRGAIPRYTRTGNGRLSAINKPLVHMYISSAIYINVIA